MLHAITTPADGVYTSPNRHPQKGREREKWRERGRGWGPGSQDTIARLPVSILRAVAGAQLCLRRKTSTLASAVRGGRWARPRSAPLRRVRRDGAAAERLTKPRSGIFDATSHKAATPTARWPVSSSGLVPCADRVAMSRQHRGCSRWACAPAHPASRGGGCVNPSLMLRGSTSMEQNRSREQRKQKRLRQLPIAKNRYRARKTLLSLHPSQGSRDIGQPNLIHYPATCMKLQPEEVQFLFYLYTFC